MGEGVKADTGEWDIGAGAGVGDSCKGWGKVGSVGLLGGDDEEADPERSREELEDEAIAKREEDPLDCFI